MLSLARSRNLGGCCIPRARLELATGRALNHELVQPDAIGSTVLKGLNAVNE